LFVADYHIGKRFGSGMALWFYRPEIFQ